MRSVRTPDATYRRKVAVSYVLFDAVFLALRYLPIACLRLVDCRGLLSLISQITKPVPAREISSPAPANRNLGVTKNIELDTT